MNANITDSRCAGNVTDIDIECEFGETNSNSGLICCVNFRTNDIEKGKNSSLLPQLWII